MDSSFRIRGHEFRSDVLLGLRLGWTGLETLKSSSAGVALVGRLLLKADTRKQKMINRSSVEAELHAAASGAPEAKVVQSVMCDLGFSVKPALIIDAKWTAHPSSTWNRTNDAHRRGAFVVAG